MNLRHLTTELNFSGEVLLFFYTYLSTSTYIFILSFANAFSLSFFTYNSKKSVTNNMNCFQVNELERTDLHKAYCEIDWEW